MEFSVDDYPTGCLFSGIPVTCGPNRYRGSPDQLYRNNGDGTFTDVSGSSGIQVGEPYNGLGVIFLDYDNNGLQDIYVANDATPANLWHKIKTGTTVQMREVRSGGSFMSHNDLRLHFGLGTH